MDLTGDMPVTLIIKAPNQRLEDHTVDCMLGWTIKKLKQHLEKVYPSKPKHNEQRLIYSGRLLQDHLTLKEILRQYEGSEMYSNKHTVHLVCSSLESSSLSASGSKTATDNSVSPVMSSETLRKETIQGSPGEGLRHRVSQSPVNNISYQGTHIGEQFAAVSPYSPEQYAWMMQQYAYSQYMLQYMQYYQTAMYSGLPQTPYTGFGGQIYQPNLAQPPVTNRQPEPQPAPERENVRMNAQGGEDEEEDEPRDWLHHVYFFLRFLTFMAILFFYSNLTRFMLVFTGSFVIYVLQKIRKHWQRVQREQREIQQRQQQEQQQQEQASNQHQETDPVNQNEENRAAGTEAETDTQGPVLSRALVFIFNTIQTFFTSLLPAPPELLEAN